MRKVLKENLITKRNIFLHKYYVPDISNHLKPFYLYKHYLSTTDGSSTYNANIPLQDELKSILKTCNTDIRERFVNNKIVYTLKECKLCNKGNRDKLDNIWKLTVWDRGSYYCHRCSCSGSLKDLKQKIFNISNINDENKINHTTTNNNKNNKINNSKHDKTYIIPNQQTMLKNYFDLFPEENPTSSSSSSSSIVSNLRNTTTLTLNHNSAINNSTNTTQKNHKKGTTTIIDNQARCDVKRYLNETRGISDQILKKYNVG